MDATIKNRLAVIVANQGWQAATAWLEQHHPGQAFAPYRERIATEFAFERRASLISAVVSLAGPVVAVASYHLFAKGLQPISGPMAWLMALILIGLIALGILGAWQAHLQAKRLSAR